MSGPPGLAPFDVDPGVGTESGYQKHGGNCEETSPEMAEADGLADTFGDPTDAPVE